MLVAWRFAAFVGWRSALVLLGHHEHQNGGMHQAAKCIAIVAAFCWTHLLAKGIALRLQELWHWTGLCLGSHRRAENKFAA
eukprot:3688234-Alexandrium_andersonii.AAC.1